MSHVNLLNEDDEQVRNQLENSKKIIESKIGKQCSDFSIPYGGKDSFDESILEKIHNAGYDNIYSTIPTFKEKRTSYRLIGRQNSKANRNNILFLRSKYYMKSILNSLKW